MSADHDEEEVTGSGCGEAWMMQQLYQNWMTFLMLREVEEKECCIVK